MPIESAAGYSARAQLAEIALRDRARRPEVHVYRPAPEVLRGMAGFLDFERSYVETLLAAGFEDAIDPKRFPI